VKTYLWSKKTLNLYITSTNIEGIAVKNNKGIALHNTLFNGDKGILKVKNPVLLK